MEFKDNINGLCPFVTDMFLMKPFASDVIWTFLPEDDMGLQRGQTLEKVFE